MVSGGLTVVKYLIFVFNFIFFLAGCGILGIGIWLRVEKNDYAQFTEYDFVTAANLAIAAGVVIIVITFLGCCGAIKENRLMLLLFFIVLLIIFVLEITAGILGYVYREKVETKIRDDWTDVIQNRYKGSEGLQNAVNKFQVEFDCCGVKNYTDWMTSTFYTDPTIKLIPVSCCKEGERTNADCTTYPQQLAVMNQKGCYKEVKSYFKDNLLIVGVSGLSFAAIQVLGMILALVLYCGIQKEGSYV